MRKFERQWGVDVVSLVVIMIYSVLFVNAQFSSLRCSFEHLPRRTNNMSNHFASVESVGNLAHSCAEILGGLLNSIVAVFQSILALAINTVEAFFGILRALFTGIVDLMSSAVGFVIGNIFVLTVLGAAYWFFTTQSQRGRATHENVKAHLKQ